MSVSRSLFFVDTKGSLGPEGLGRSSMVRTESRQICHVLGLRDDVARKKLMTAIQTATLGRARAVLMVGAEPQERRMISVRPAREPGWAVVTCTDMAGAIEALDTGALVDLFALSPAEADIAVMLAQGSTLGEVAERRLVQQETVRGQVKVILRKIGVANQKQLAGLLTQVAMALQDAPLGEAPSMRPMYRAAS
jgi:DNA-binding CsgD family transcriptional regulator